MGAHTRQTPLVVVTGGITPAAAAGVERVIERTRTEDPGTAVVHHDLRDVRDGLVRRRVRHGATDQRWTLTLRHGCVSCTLREDILPLLRELGRRPEVRRIVLQLDAALDPEPACWAIRHVVVDGVPVTDTVELRGVVAVIDSGTWLDAATGDAEIAAAGLADLPDDERTLAQLVVAQAEFADVVVHAGNAEPWELARSTAVLARLNPRARRVLRPGREVLLDDLPPGARRGEPEDPHAPLLLGEPPLDDTAGIRLFTFTARRPFHPDRLHAAVDVLLDGVVRARGRVWLATRPDAVLWLGSAGGGLEIGHAGEWLAAAADWSGASPERRAAADLRWHPRWGDRVQELAILVHDADPDDIDVTLRGALLNDRELAAGEAAWRALPDPFGWHHTDPCDDITPAPTTTRTQEDQA
ncbi:MAG: ribosome hibernation factor-recruiting GTPase MRF [Pseudonocardia sp.]